MLKLLFLVLVASWAQQLDDTPELKPGVEAFSSRIVRTQRTAGSSRVSLSLSRTERVTLSLVPNTDLLAADYAEYDLSASGARTTLRGRADVPVCWYTGQILGDQNSSVFASDCDSGFHSVIQRSSGVSYIARSVSGGDPDDVIVYRADDEVETNGTCGVGSGDAHDPEVHGEHMHSDMTLTPPMRRLLDYSTAANVVEVAVVSDRLYIQAAGGAYGRNLTAVSERNIQIMNIVQATYEATGFAKPTTVKIKAQYFFSSGDPYSMTVDGNGEVDQGVLLSNFASWAGSLPVKYDHLHLLTNYDLTSSVIGLAYVAAACTSSNTGLSMANSAVRAVANTVAHELGHNLGMWHDSTSGTGQADDSACPASGYLMAAISSCPSSGLCPVSSCSISNKNAYNAACTYNTTSPTCVDGVQNGDETGVDCGGSLCAACGAGGCSNNNGGCAQVCTPNGPTAYVCSCSDASMYINPADGVSCVQDVNQCLSSPCAETCTNTVGPGNSFTCSCALPRYLSLADGRSCLAPSCFDRRKNQDEVMVDCGGVCSRPCSALTSTVNFQYYYDRALTLSGGQWRSWDNNNQYQLVVHGVTVRYVYKQGTNQWIYDTDLDPSGYYGVAFQSSATPFSGNWQILNGTAFVVKSFAFATSAAYSAAVCGNGVVDGGEECDSCLVYSGGKCVKANPCCDATCLSPKVRGTSCSVDGFAGACWDGNCINRGASCDVITAINYCFGASTAACGNYTGGAGCDGISESGPFAAGSCNASFYCYSGCVKTLLSNSPRLGQIRGYPCSAADANGVYPSVCDGGADGSGELSSCVPVSSLVDYPTQAPSVVVASAAPTAASTVVPTSVAPTAASTSLPTSVAPTPASILLVTSVIPTPASTLLPTSVVPTPASTLLPTSLAPTARPSTSVPTTRPTTVRPTTRTPTSKPPTQFPSKKPTRAPTVRPSTRAPTSRPSTLRPTARQS